MGVCVCVCVVSAQELLSRVPNLLRPERAVSFQQCISKIEECLYLSECAQHYSLASNHTLAMWQC